LHVGVLVAQVIGAARRRILRESRRPQQHLVDRRVVALRQRGDRGLSEIVGIGTRALQDRAARLIEGGGLCAERGGGRRSGCGRSGSCLGDRRRGGRRRPRRPGGRPATGRVAEPPA